MVDEFGDNVGAAMMPGGGWTQRHDGCKWTIAQQASDAKYDLVTEAANLFLPWIQQREAFMSEQKARKRQGMIPDFLDVQRQKLMDVKGCSYCKSWYSSARFYNAISCDGVLRRQAKVDMDCQYKARKVDEKYNGWVKNDSTPGPMAQRLQSFGRVEGLVVGAHGEGSPDLLHLLKRIANRAAQTRYRVLGFRSSRAARSTVLKQIHVAVGVEAIRGMARLRIANLGSALAGTASNKAATARRNQARHLFHEQNQAYFARHCYYDI